MLHEEGLENVFARHARHGEATRRAVRAWGLEIVCADPERYSSSVTAVFVPPTSNADEFRKVVLENFNMSLGSGLGKTGGQGFPHRASRRLQRPHAGRNALRSRNGSGAGGCSAFAGRRGRRARISDPRGPGRSRASRAGGARNRVAGKLAPKADYRRCTDERRPALIVEFIWAESSSLFLNSLSKDFFSLQDLPSDMGGRNPWHLHWKE